MDTNACKAGSCFGTCTDKKPPNLSFSCAACPSGTKGDGKGAKGCTDVNDCTKDPKLKGNPCGAGGSCKDSGRNQYKCTCRGGYTAFPASGLNSQCVHTNACASGAAKCIASATCNHVVNSLPPIYTCACGAGFSGDGRASSIGGNGCRDTDGCKNKRCATLPAGGPGTAPKCVDNPAPASGATCSTCPPGYNANPAGGDTGVCTDKNDCAAGKPSCGPAAKGCQEDGVATNKFKCTCVSGFVFKRVTAKCMLDDSWIKDSGTCSGATTEAKLLANLNALKALVAGL